MDPWQKAFEQFQRSLNAEDKKLFAATRPEDLRREVTRCEIMYRRSSVLKPVTEKLRPLLYSMERYAQTLESVSKSVPGILVSLWGGMRILLKVAATYENYFFKLLDMLERVGDALPRYETYEELFASHEPLQEALSAVYLEILLFFAHAKKVFSKSTFRVFPQAVWGSFNRSFDLSLRRLERLRDLVEDEAKVASMIEAKEERELAAGGRRKVEQLKHTVDTREHATQVIDIRKWLRARVCHQERAGVVDARAPGSCQWIFSQPQFSRWVDDKDVQLFWIHGPAGCGKSFLYSCLLDHLNTRNTLVYFFFCGTDKERVDLSALLRSWTFQLITLYPEVVPFVTSFKGQYGSAESTSGETLDLFLRLLDRVPSCFLTVDALDECPDKAEFPRILERIPKRFKVLILSRETVEAQKGLRTMRENVASLKVDPQLTQVDIMQYIERTIKNQDPPFNSQIAQKIRQRLSDCDGMFLWVRLMFEHIQQQTNDFEVLRCLDELPNGLSETYERILGRVNNLPQPRRVLALKVMFWALRVRRPISVSELCGLLAVNMTTEDFDETRMIRDPETTIVTVCGGLIEVRYNERVIYTPHFTITQYLKAYLERNEVLSEIMESYSAPTLKSSESLAAAVCIRYLGSNFISALQQPGSHADADNLLTHLDRKAGLLPYAISHWFNHVNSIGDPDRFVIDEFRQFSNPAHPNLVFCWRAYWFSCPDSYKAAICPTNFSALHIAAYFGLDGVIKEMLKVQDLSSLDHLGRSALWWAVAKSRESTTKVLLDAGLDPTMPDIYSVSPLHIAAAAGHCRIFKDMISRTDNTDAFLIDAQGWTPLHWAASRGQDEIIDEIIKREAKEFGTSASISNSGRTPLHIAALNGHVEASRALSGLLKVVNFADGRGFTALHLAASRGHVEITGILLRNGADLTIHDKSGRTAADKAKEMGQFELYTMLISFENGLIKDRGHLDSGHMDMGHTDHQTIHTFQGLRSSFDYT